MVGLKEKVVGILLIALGVWPFLLKIQSVSDYFSSYTFLSVLTPGEIVYQLAIVVLGVLLIWSFRVRAQQAR
jgi:hypothetical protein